MCKHVLQVYRFLNLTLFGPLEFLIKINCTVKSVWSILYIELKFQKNIFISLKIDFVLANSADPDEMQHHAAFYLGLHCLHNAAFHQSSLFAKVPV